jgi:DNA polymerase-3 subunit gamma/tau
VLFIFATTEPDKLISTIRSRTHHYPFRLVPPAILNSHLEKICTSEGIKVAKGVISLVVRASGGSVRDSLSILGQLLAGAGSDGVTYEIAVALLGYTDSALIDEALDAIAAQDSASLFTTIDRVIESGQDPKRFASDLLERMRDIIIVGASDENNSAILISLATDQLDRIRTQAKLIGIATLIRSADLIAQGLTQMRGATPPRLILELICGQMMLPAGDNVNITARIEKLEKSSSLISPSISTSPVMTQSAPIKEAKPVKEVVDKVVESKPVQHKSSGSIDITSLRRMWPQVIDSVKGKRRLTWSLLATSAQILSLDEENITIGIVNSGARDSFVRSESDVILSDAFEEVTGVRRNILATVDSSVATTTMARADEDPGDKDMLSGADLLASKLGAKVIKESN